MSNPISSSRGENLATLRQKLDQMGVEVFFLDRENAQGWNKKLPDLHFVDMKMATWFKPDPYSGEINTVNAEGRKSSSAATNERNDNKKFTVKRDDDKFFMGSKFHISNSFGPDKKTFNCFVGLKLIWLQFLGSLSVISENTLMAKKHTFHHWKDS